MIDSLTIAKILDAARIEEVVSDFVTLKKRGANYIGLCPFHNEKTPSFNVSPARGIFKCFGCGKGGSSVHFIMEHEHLKYPDALRYLAKKYHIEIVEKELTEEDKQVQLERESLFTINEYAAKHFAENLTETEQGRAIGLSYFRERGFTDEIVKKFQLGYALNEWCDLTDTAQKSGYDLSLFEKACLCKHNSEKDSTYDFFRDRVIFPWFTVSGRVVAFTGRLLTKETKGVNQKYLNSGETAIFKKTDQIFGIYQAKNAIAKNDNVFIVEGQTDVISMHQCGIENVVACSGGTGLSAVQARLLRRFTKNVTLMYDCDLAGEKYTNEAINVALTEELNVRVVQLPEGEDPDSFARTHNASDFIDFIEKNQVDFARFKCNHLLKVANNDPIKKSKLITDLVESLSLINDLIVRSMFVKDCAALIDIEESKLHNEINKLRDKSRREKQKPQKRDETGENGVPEELPPPPEMPEEVVVPSKTVATPYEAEEKNVLSLLVRYTNEILYEETTENGVQTVRVCDYILEELVSDNIVFQNPLHEQMLNELRQHIDDTTFNSSYYFIHHQSCEMSALAAELVTDRYTKSKFFLTFLLDETKREEQNKKEFHEWLLQAVPCVVLELKYKIVCCNLENAKKRLRTDSSEEAVSDYTKWLNIKKTLANTNELGHRIIG